MVGIPSKINKLSERLLKFIYVNLPTPEKRDPVFIIGTGRSGTTIFGRTLAVHSKIAYLNEPRDLWIASYPETDIWSSEAKDRNGKLFLSEKDKRPNKAKKLRRSFYFKTFTKSGDTLIEKLPINCFRLEFLMANFPEARFIFITRNGLNVAQSIKRRSEKGEWFGKNDYKWIELCNYAYSKAEFKELPDYCSNYYEKGLLEWRLSNEAALNFFKDLNKNHFLEVRYEQLAQNPSEVLTKILHFLNLSNEKKIESYALNNIKAHNQVIKKELSERESFIGGDLLLKSMDKSQFLTDKI